MNTTIKPKKPLWKSLGIHVFLAILIGIILGLVSPKTAVEMKPISDWFLWFVRLLVGPIVFLTVICGIIGMGDLKRLGKVGAKALIYFEVVSTFALVVGMVVANVIQPGTGIHAVASQLDASKVAGYSQTAQHRGIGEVLYGALPLKPWLSFAHGEVLQILVLALIIGFAIAIWGKKAKRLHGAFETLQHYAFIILGFLMRFSPLAAFAAMAVTIGQFGWQALINMAWALGSMALGCTLFILLVLGGIARLNGFRITKLVNYLKNELLIIFGTSSSETVIGPLMQKLQKLGAPKDVVGVVIPAGYSFNLDGTNIYLAMAVGFLAQALDIHLSLGSQLSLLLILMITSKGASGVTGAGFITLAATLAAVNGEIPVVAIVLLLGVDKFMSEMRALTNMVGNAVACLVVGNWEKVLDKGKLNQELNLGYQEPQSPSKPVEEVYPQLSLTKI